MAYPYKPYRYLRDVEDAQLVDLITQQIEETLQSNSLGQMQVCRCQGQHAGMAALRFLPWDSRIFRKKMARVEHLIAVGTYGQKLDILDGLISRLVVECENNGVEHVSARVDASDLPCIHALEQNGFRVMDVLVTYYLDLSLSPATKMGYTCTIREQTPDDIETVVSLAREAFHGYLGRFHTDPHLHNDRCDELYAEWVRNSCLRTAADYVAVAELAEQIVGFATFAQHKHINTVTGTCLVEPVLIAVSPVGRGRNVYTSFVAHGIQWAQRVCSPTTSTGLFIKTQIGNIAVQRAWCNLGLRPAASHVTLHKSLRKEGE